jgi:hypothetical protein
MRLLVVIRFMADYIVQLSFEQVFPAAVIAGVVLGRLGPFLSSSRS